MLVVRVLHAKMEWPYEADYGTKIQPSVTYLPDVNDSKRERVHPLPEKT